MVACPCTASHVDRQSGHAHSSGGEPVDELVLRGPAVAVDVWTGAAHLGEPGILGQYQVAVLELRMPAGGDGDNVGRVGDDP